MVIDFEYQALKEFTEAEITTELSDLSEKLLEDVQELLTFGGFYKGDIDSKFSNELAKAFADFKESIYLENPEMLGSASALSLIELVENRDRQKAEAAEADSETNDLNSKSGTSMKLPNGDIVYQNQRIIKEIPLTWGEVTKGCSRKPVSNKIVTGINKVTKTFGEVRDKFESPLSITSGYRDPVSNRKCGGASRSQHLTGNALDVFPLNGNLTKLYQVCKGCDTVDGLGDGRHKGFVHIDARGHRAYWSY